MEKKHFVKVWTRGNPDRHDYRIYGATDDGNIYLINKEVLKQ